MQSIGFKGSLERLEDGTDQTISIDGSNRSNRGRRNNTPRIPVDLKEWVIKNFLTIGGALHKSDHDLIAELLHDDETF